MCVTFLFTLWFLVVIRTKIKHFHDKWLSPKCDAFRQKKSKCASSLYADKQQTIIGSSLISLPIDTIALTLVAVHQKSTQSSMNRSQPVR